MRGWCAWSLLAAVLLVAPGEHALSRRKRHLVFPEGSNFVMTMTDTNVLPFKYPKVWRALIECETAFKLPNATRKALAAKKRRPGPYYQHRRDRRDLYKQLETLLDMRGLDGGACVKRAICEAASLLPSAEASFIQDTMRLIFTLPPGNKEDPDIFQYETAAAMSDCEPWSVACPFSLLHFQLPWD